MAKPSSSEETDTKRLYLVFGLAFAGLITVCIISTEVLLVVYYSKLDLSYASQFIGPVTAIVGTLVGTIAGHHGGAIGKERVEARANMLDKKAMHYRELLYPLLSPEEEEELKRFEKNLEEKV